MLYRRGNDCRLGSVFRDSGGEETAGAAAGPAAAGVASAADGLTATWAAALGAAMLGPAQEADVDKVREGRKERREQEKETVKCRMIARGISIASGLC